MLEIKNLYLSYTKEYFTLNDINLKVERGQHLVLLGEKESGKSSLIRILAGLEKPTKGEVLLLNKPIGEVSFKTDLQMGYLSSFGAFFNRKSVRKNLNFVLQIRGLKKEEITSQVNACILVNKLENIASLQVRNLSAYDKLRVAIARLSLRPLDFIVIDDVFENTSEEETKKLAELVNELIAKNENATVIVAVSKLSVAEYFKGKVVKLEYGSIME